MHVHFDVCIQIRTNWRYLLIGHFTLFTRTKLDTGVSEQFPCDLALFGDVVVSLICHFTLIDLHPISLLEEVKMATTTNIGYSEVVSFSSK